MTPKISEAEWKIMELLWQNSPLSSQEIIDSLKGKVDWSHQTIRTLVNRLLNKKAIQFEKDGRAYLYSPTVSEKECKKSERKSFLSRVYKGAHHTMLAAFLEDTKLTPEEIEDLENILNQKRKSS